MKRTVVFVMVGVIAVAGAIFFGTSRRPETRSAGAADAKAVTPAQKLVQATPAPASQTANQKAAPTAPVFPAARPPSPLGERDPIEVALDDRADFDTRMQAVRELGRGLTLAERQRIYAYLRGHGDSLSPAERYNLKNDLLNVLVEQSSPPVELTPFLVSLFRDIDQEPAMRDYALQHLAAWQERSPASDFGLITTTLAEAGNQRKEAWAGTALLGLYRIATSPIRPGNVQGLMLTPVTSLIRDPEADLGSRITAAQLAGRIEGGLGAVAPQLETIATDESQDKVLRMAAIATLRNAPNPPSSIAKLATHSDARIRAAATGKPTSSRR